MSEESFSYRRSVEKELPRMRLLFDVFFQDERDPYRGVIHRYYVDTETGTPIGGA